MKRTIPYLVLLLTLACALPAQPAPATPLIDTTLAATETTPLGPAPPAAPTRPPAPTPTPTGVRLASCVYPPIPSNAALPDLSKLHWETRPDGARVLIGLDYPAQYMIASPDGSHLAVTFVLGSEFQIPIEATALIDTSGGENRWLSTESHAYDYLYQWLPDGRLLWLDTHGDLYVNDRHLHPPVPMHEIKGVSGDIAFLSPETSAWRGGDWRVDMAASQWEMLDATAESPGAALGVSADGSYAMTAPVEGGQDQEGYLYRVWQAPVRIGQHAEPVFEYHAQPVGTDGYTFKPIWTANLAGTDIWSVGGMFDMDGQGSAYQFDSLLLDLGQKRALTPPDFGLDASYDLLGGDISPDRQWLAVSLAEHLRFSANPPYPAVDNVYLTTRSATGGTVFTDHAFLGWAARAAVLQDNKTGTVVISPLPPDGSTIPLDGAASFLPIYGPWEGASPGLIFTRQADRPMQIQRFDEQGKLLSTLDLSAGFNTLFPWWTAASREALYLSVAQADTQAGACHYVPSIIAWPLRP